MDHIEVVFKQVLHGNNALQWEWFLDIRGLIGLFSGQNHFGPTWLNWSPSTNAPNKWPILLFLQKLLDLIILWLSLNRQELLVARSKRSTATNLGHSSAGKEGLAKAKETYRPQLMNFGPAFWIHQAIYEKQSDYKTFCVPTPPQNRKTQAFNLPFSILFGGICLHMGPPKQQSQTIWVVKAPWFAWNRTKLLNLHFSNYG